MCEIREIFAAWVCGLLGTEGIYGSGGPGLGGSGEVQVGRTKLKTMSNRRRIVLVLSHLVALAAGFEALSVAAGRETARRSFGTPEKRLGGALLAIPDEPTPEKVSRGLSALAVTRVELGEPMASVLELRMLAAAARASETKPTSPVRCGRARPVNGRSVIGRTFLRWGLVASAGVTSVALESPRCPWPGAQFCSRCRNSHAVRWGRTSAPRSSGPPLHGDSDVLRGRLWGSESTCDPPRPATRRTSLGHRTDSPPVPSDVIFAEFRRAIEQHRPHSELLELASDEGQGENPEGDGTESGKPLAERKVTVRTREPGGPIRVPEGSPRISRWQSV